MQEIEERIRSLQSCLKSVLDIYRGYEKEFHAREIGNLYETTPFYKTNGFKIGVGAFVVTGCVVLAVVAFLGVAIVTGAAVGSALGAVFGGTIGGITAERNGGSFLDGFADGMLVGAIGGAISGTVGEATATAGLVVSMAANGVTDSAIYAGETVYRGGEITSRGLTVSFLTGAVLSGVTRIGVGKYTKAKGIEIGKGSTNTLYMSGYTELSNAEVVDILKTRGLDEGAINDLITSFDGPIYKKIGYEGEVFTITESRGGDAAGVFVTRGSAGSTPAERINNLALPPNNSALIESQVELARTQILLEGKVAPQREWAVIANDGIPRTGGAWQVVTDGGRYSNAIRR